MGDTTRGRKTLWTMAVAAAALGISGCTLIVKYSDGPDNTGELPACDDGTDDRPRDLVLSLQNFSFHIGNLTEARVVNPAGFVVARAVLDPMPGPELLITMPKALYEGPHTVDVFADLNQSGAYEPPPGDHSWRVQPCKSGVYRLVHNSNFVNIDDPPPQRVGGDFILSLENFSFHLGQMMEVHVLDQASGRTVGFYRLAELQTEQFDFIIPGVIEQAVPYVVAFFADRNGNLAYDLPDQDHSWRLEATGDAAGLHITFSHNTNFADISQELGLTRAD